MTDSVQQQLKTYARQCHLLQVLVASPPLQQFFAQPNVKLRQGPLGGALQEVFDQVQLGKLLHSIMP